jgi:hypothetical protein
MNEATAPARGRAPWGWIAAVGVLVLALAGVALYAFLLNVDLSDAQRRLSREIGERERAEKYLADTRAQLVEKQREVEQLKAQLDYAADDYSRLATQKPPLPVTVNFRSSWLGQGLVAELHNASPRFLGVVLVVRNPTLSTVRRFNLELRPDASVSFGHLEGWRFSSGDELTLYHDAYAATKAVAP